jgi:hypothetical protein
VDGGGGGERDEPGLDVPLGPITTGSGGRRQAALVLAIGGVAIGLALALAAVPATETRPSGDTTAIRRSVTTPTPPSPSPTSRAASTRREELLSLPNQALDGAPNAVLVERRGDDARLMAWNPGDELRLVRTMRDAFTSARQFAFLSPDASSLLVASLHPGDEPMDTVRLVTGDGRVAWEHDEVSMVSGIVWSADSRKVALVGHPGVWWVIHVDASGSAEPQRVVVQEAATTDSSGPPPSAAPTGGGTRAPTPRGAVPVGFSPDGKWLYGAVLPDYGGAIRPTVRVSLADGAVEALAAVESAAIDPASVRGLDPASGRAFGWGPNASVPGGPPTIEVVEPDGTIAYRVVVGVVLGAAWVGTGELLLLEADGLPFPTELQLLRVAEDGSLESPLLATGPVAQGQLLGVRDGFAALSISTQRPTEATQLVMVDLAEGRTSGLTLALDGQQIRGSGLLP